MGGYKRRDGWLGEALGLKLAYVQAANAVGHWIRFFGRDRLVLEFWYDRNNVGNGTLCGRTLGYGSLLIVV